MIKRDKVPGQKVFLKVSPNCKNIVITEYENGKAKSLEMIQIYEENDQVYFKQVVESDSGDRV